MENITKEEYNYERAYHLPIEPKQHQIRVEDALNLRLVDLFTESDGASHKYLSRADLILIFTLYPNGLSDFLEDYISYVEYIIWLI